MLFAFRLALFQLALSTAVYSGSVQQDGACSTENNRLDPSSHKFLSDCDDKTFCSASVNGTCQQKQCRRDEFPFGYFMKDPLPPLCPDGTFCPDEGSGCRNLIPVGQACQLNRDDQCAPPGEQWSMLASHQNFNGSLCLQSTCIYANATLGQRCILDGTTYIDLGPGGEQFSNTIYRHNCRTPEFFCDQDALQCLPTKTTGLPCKYDQECQTLNCDEVSNMCINPPDMPVEVAPWQYALTIIFVIFAMAATVAMLIMIHKRIRLQRYWDLREYYEEQLSLRHSLFAMHSAAADSFTDQKLRLSD